MKRNKIPDNQLDIITPVLNYEAYLFKQDAAYPELQKLRNVKQEDRQETELHLITEKTPLVARKATEIIAYYFKREFRYDFPGYHPQEQNDARDRVFLLTQGDWETRDVIGAIVFRWRNYSNAPAQLVLAWVWIHPFLRRQGILTTYWETFRNVYGDFRVEPRFSQAMKSFLIKNGYQFNAHGV